MSSSTVTIYPIYRGRFAPSPTGPLHFGSLVAALGSYLDARAHHGTWLLRMEDLDVPRCVPGAADGILRTLEACGLHWDGEVLYQSQRSAAYEHALQQLQDSGAVYSCGCTRKEIADSAVQGVEGFVYPGTCREKGLSLSPGPSGETSSHSTRPSNDDGQVAGYPMDGRGELKPVAWRVRTDTPFPVRTERSANARSRSVADASTSLALPATLMEHLATRLSCQETAAKSLVISTNGVMEFQDALQGPISQHLEREIGDFVVKRADGLFAYQLAVVVDDAFQGVTHVVRGADLLASTPRQIWLQRLLGLSTPAYMHLPVAVNAAGEKLSKQTLAAPVESRDAAGSLWRALTFLRQEPPPELAGDRQELLAWAVRNWHSDVLRGLKTLPALA